MQKKRISHSLFGMMLGLVSLGAYAEHPGVIKQSNMSLKLANELVESTMKACHDQGRSAVVVVLDRGGHVLSIQRDETVGPHNTEAARKKAFTALSTKTPSRQFAENIRNNPDAAFLHAHDELLLIGGGVPVKVGNEVIGAIGVGGAGGSAIDEGCAVSALEKVLGSMSK